MSKENKQDVAVSYSSKGFNCAQSVVIPFAKDFNIDENIALAMTGAMGGGVRCGEICGAILGASCVVGLKYGQILESDSETKAICNNKTKQLINEFQNIHQEVTCKSLLGYNLNELSKEEMIQIKDSKKAKCTQYIKDCVTIAENIIYEND